jgi:diguanylate cyclase (GGDEF)-like protein
MATSVAAPADENSAFGDTNAPPAGPRLWRAHQLLAAWVALALAYVVAARFGLQFAVVNASATAVWPASGIALAALLYFGPRLWPGVFLGAFLANLLTAGGVATSLGIAVGSTLEAVAGAALLQRFAGGRHAVERASYIVRLVFYAAIASTMVSATVGVTTLALGGLAQWHDFWSIWTTWWLGDAGGDIVIAPLLLLWLARPRVQWTAYRWLEALALLVALGAVALFVFGGLPGDQGSSFPLEFLCMPLLLWSAYRFGRREAATAVLVVSGIATWGTVHGRGPFVTGTLNESLVLLQVFTGVNALTSLVLASVVAERESVEGQLRRLAVTDALTGLSNYRQLLDVLEQEIQRSARTKRSFAVLLLDLDRLKDINDRHGHLTGSKALCRVADAMRTTCRTIDTAARYGGDEFALVLPEADDNAAYHVTARIAAALESDGQSPRVTVSAGYAVYPRDGATAEALLSTADLMLYDMKAGSGQEGHRSA